MGRKLFKVLVETPAGVQDRATGKMYPSLERAVPRRWHVAYQAEALDRPTVRPLRGARGSRGTAGVVTYPSEWLVVSPKGDVHEGTDLPAGAVVALPDYGIWVHRK